MSTIDRVALANALSAWRTAIGASYISTDQPSLHRAGTATHETGTEVAAILRPADRAEVQACLQIATRYGVPVYPISSGRNWGYGSSAPSSDAVLLDLGRLNRILDYDEDLAYVTIEPGVTQRQLFDYLSKRGSRLWMDATGSSPDCSIIGNTLERGFGHTPHGDHAANACGFEVVLPDGTCIETGFSRFANSRVGALSRGGVGPSLDGLFVQSNFGVVTRMTVWLMPAPEHFEAFFFQCGDQEGLPRVVDALRPLRMNGTLRSVVHIGNEFKILAGIGQYPWQRTNATPLDERTRAALRKELGIGLWSGSGGLYGTRRQVKEAKRQIRRALKGKVDRLQFINDRLLRYLPWLAAPFKRLTGHDLCETMRLLVPVYELLKGVPTSHMLAGAYWRKRTPVPSQPNPDRDRCGLLWFCPVAPSTAEDAAAVNEVANAVLTAHGFEPIVSVSLMSERAIVSVIALTYDRDVPGEDTRARRCHDELVAEMLARGYPPYRLGLASMDVAAEDAQYGRLVGAFKAVIDPTRVLAPGRYESEANAPVERCISVTK